MAITKSQEIKHAVRDTRTLSERIADFLSRTDVTIGWLCLSVACVIAFPWTVHPLIIVGLLWWSSVAFRTDRQTLPLFLPAEAKNKDYHDLEPGSKNTFEKSKGIFFLGNELDTNEEIWETSSVARQHRLVFGTTGAGKSEMLTGLYVNSLIVGAGIIFSDAKGTLELSSKFYNVARRFGRDDDFFTINYITAGRTIRAGSSDRISNTIEPTAFATADQIIQMLTSYLPKSSGDNQIFQDRAVQMISSVVPALVDLRDLHRRPIGIATIKDYALSITKILELAYDENNLLPHKSKEILMSYLESLAGFSRDEFLHGNSKGQKGVKYPLSQEANRLFSIAANYFSRALSSLSDTYGHIYSDLKGELDYQDAVRRRRIVTVTFPSLEKSPQELLNLAKLNLSNIRGAIAIGLGGRIEGRRQDTIDNLPTKAETPTQIILDEYGYQATDGFAITMAQARGLNFSITIAGQDLSNLEMGSKDEAEAIFGNAVLISMKVTNVKGLGEKIKEAVGEADIEAISGSEKRYTGPFMGYVDQKSTSVQRRYRVSPSDLIDQSAGQAYYFGGKYIGVFRYRPWAPLPAAADIFQVNRYLPISTTDLSVNEAVVASINLSRLLKRRMEGNSRPLEIAALPPRAIEWLQGVNRHAKISKEPGSDPYMSSLLDIGEDAATHTETTSLTAFTTASSTRPLVHMDDDPGYWEEPGAPGEAFNPYDSQQVPPRSFFDRRSTTIGSVRSPFAREDDEEVRRRQVESRFMNERDEDSLTDSNAAESLRAAMAELDRQFAATKPFDPIADQYPAHPTSANASLEDDDNPYQPSADHDSDIDIDEQMIDMSRGKALPTVTTSIPSRHLADDVVGQVRKDADYQPPANAPNKPLPREKLLSALNQLRKQAAVRHNGTPEADDRSNSGHTE